MLPVSYKPNPAPEPRVHRTQTQQSSLRPLPSVIERSEPSHENKDWKLEVAALKAELDRERGAQVQIVEQRLREREREVRTELLSEWSKNEAAWKERVRNERLLRLSYERVLLNLGFSPSRIASDIVRVSRPQPLHEDPGTYNTLNLLDIEAGMVSQPSTRRKGMFSYSIEDIKASMNPPVSKLSDSSILPLRSSVEDPYGGIVPVENNFFPVSEGMVNELRGSRGKRDLLKVLSNKT
jgi:hypothetical protein